MGIHIHDLPEDLDLGQLSSVQGGSFSWGLANFDTAGGLGLGATPLYGDPEATGGSCPG